MSNEIFGVIKLGQLKRIQAVLHRNLDDKNRFENRNRQEEISFIKKEKVPLLTEMHGICLTKLLFLNR